MKEESHNPEIDPELEARIVALVLGEASDFERDELNRLIEERPELTMLKDQIQSVHGLLRDVGTGEALADDDDDDDWKLSAGNRSSVLAVIGEDAEKQSAKQSLKQLAEKRRSVKGNSFSNLTRIAAVVCFVVLPGSMAILAFVNYRSTEADRSSQLTANGAYSRDSNESSEAFWEEGPATSRDFYLMDGATITAAEGDTAEPAAGAGIDAEMDSKSALGAIRGALDFDMAATAEGVNGPEPSPQQITSYSVPVAKEETEPSGGLDADGYRLTDAQPIVQKADNGELSFPKFAIRTGELNALDPTESVGSKVSVPDEGTVLLGGIKRYAEGRGETAASGESTLSSPMTDEYFRSDGGGETQDAAIGRDRVLGFDDRPGLGRQSVRSGLATLDEIEKSRDDHRQSLSEFDGEAGEDKFIDDFVEYGGSLGGGGGGFGGAGREPADERRNEISAEHNPQDISKGQSSVWRDTHELVETAPSQPMEAGIGDRPETTDAGVYFDSKISGTARLANSIRSPTNKPTASTQDLRSKGKLAAEARHEEEAQQEIGRESVTISLSDDATTLFNSRTRDHGKAFSRQMSESVAGAATAQPRGGREAGQAKQDDGWGYQQDANGDSGRHGQDFGTSPPVRYRKVEETDQPATITSADGQQGIEKRVESSLGEISAHTELHKNSDIAGDLPIDDYGKDVDQLGARPQSELKDEQGGLLRQRGQPAVAGESVWHKYVPPMLANNAEPKKKWRVTRSAAPAGLNEKTAESEAFSTFSLHVSDVSFKLAHAALAQGEWPEAAKVRIEEFVNAFDYGDPMPSQSEKVACCLEQSIHPFLQQRNLLRISMRTAAAGRSSSTPLRLTLLLDNSGSMERADRQQTVRRAFALLAQQLRPIDQVTLISFARQPRLLADKVSGAQSHQLVQLTHNLPSEGGTNIEAALQLAFEKAQEQQLDDAQNRIILLTDGAVNLGDANPESLSRMITTMRNAGIAFDAAGISAEGLNDEILEALTRKGDGRYYLLDSLEAADDGFARQIAGALRPSAKNVKVQIEFNPKRVGRYKLLGFEKHRLKQEDFRNDQVDAAEMAAAEAGVAVYQFEAKPKGEGDVGSVSVRFRDLSTGQMIEHRWPIPYEANAPRPEQAAPSLRIATSAALLAAKLRGEPLGETVDLKTLSDLIAGLPDRDRNSNRVQQLQLMIQQARQMSGK